MDIAVIGANAQALCCLEGICVQPLPAPEDAEGWEWDIIALTRSALRRPFRGVLRARSLLLPGDSAPGFALSESASQVIGYGFSPRDTLTLSSLEGRILCLQRSVFTLDGTLLEPQELPLPAALDRLPAEQALLAAGLLLLSRRVGS